MEDIYRSFNTIIEMLNDRGITISEGFDAGQIDSFISNQASKPGFEIVIGGKIRLIYCVANKFKMSDIKKFFENETEYDLTIIIVREKISQNNMKQIGTLCNNVQVFLLKELQYNLTKHVLVPKHTVVPEADIKAIMEKYSLKNRLQFPLILKTDPMARWLNLKSGDVVRITRPSPTSGFYESYRCCI